MGVAPLKLISWNVMRGGNRIEKQIAAVMSRRPDIVAFQEVTLNSLVGYRQLFAQAGLPYFVDSLTRVLDSDILVGARSYGVVIASKHPFDVLHAEPSLSWQERLLSILVHTPHHDIEVHTAYIPPGSSNGWMKIETLEGIYRKLSRTARYPRILCGDFNTPQRETVVGEIITWAQSITTSGQVRLRRSRGTRWDAGERNILQGLQRYDLYDVFRALHGYETEQYSWFLKRKGKVTGRRFDHVFASKALNPISCEYLPDCREQRLSDHSPIEVVFEL